MNTEQAESLKLQILERRNHLNNIDIPLKYSKASLYGGMQERVRRQEDSAFKQNIAKQKQFTADKLKVVDSYLNNLFDYNNKLNDYNNKLNEYNNRPDIPDSFGIMGDRSVPLTLPTSPIAPTSPHIALPSLPKNMSSKVRSNTMGIRSRANINRRNY